MLNLDRTKLQPPSARVSAGLGGGYAKNLIVVGTSFDYSTVFSLAYLSGCYFENCSFVDANFKGTIAENCTFKNCEFTKAEFGKTTFRRTRVWDCGFLEADAGGYTTGFLSCDIREASFYLADLRNAYFDDSILYKCDFALYLNGNVVPGSQAKVSQNTFSTKTVLVFPRPLSIATTPVAQNIPAPPPAVPLPPIPAPRPQRITMELPVVKAPVPPPKYSKLELKKLNGDGRTTCAQPGCGETLKNCGSMVAIMYCPKCE